MQKNSRVGFEWITKESLAVMSQLFTSSIPAKDIFFPLNISFFFVSPLCLIILNHFVIFKVVYLIVLLRKMLYLNELNTQKKKNI